MTRQYIPPGGVDRIPAYDPVRREHFWIMNLTHGVVDPSAYYDQPDGPVVFDKESLVLVTGPGCYYCERIWTEHLGHRRCPGETQGPR